MLFCKPSPSVRTLYDQPLDSTQQIRFRSLDLKTDLPAIHHWINGPALQPFWPLHGPIELLKSFYQLLLKNADGHSFIGIVDEQLIGQIDLYRVQADDLGQHLVAQPHDCCLHLLLPAAPHLVADHPIHLLRHFLHWYFSFPEALRLYAAPDIYDATTCRLLEKTSFVFQQNIMLSHTAASLYLMTRHHFHATQKNS